MLLQGAVVRESQFVFNSCRVQDEVGRRHSAELRDLQERLDIEKQAWEENFMKKQVSV